MLTHVIGAKLWLPSSLFVPMINAGWTHIEKCVPLELRYDMVIRYLLRMQHDISQSMSEDGRFVPDADFATMKEMAEPVINQVYNFHTVPPSPIPSRIRLSRSAGAES